MECRLREIKGNWHAAFKHDGVEYTHSLRTKSEQEAEVRLGPIRDTLYRLETGTLTIPATIDPKTFIVSGGNLTTIASKKPVSPRFTVGQMSTLYLDSLQGVEPNTRLTLKIHLDHAQRIFKADVALEDLSLKDIERYAKVRLAEQRHGKSTQSYTVLKELRTFRRVWAWANERGHSSTSPTWELKSIKLPKDRGRESFRTYDQIKSILARGGISQAEEDRLWETLYLTGEELKELLVYVREHATAPWVYPLTCMVAFTGCRRSEAMRSRIDDWNLETNIVHIREKKRDTSTDFTIRQVDVHPQLAEVMTAWFSTHSGGQHTITADGQPLTVDQATDHFSRTLREQEPVHPKWSKIRGFHTLRHSLASILASKGVDQRYIDKVMGHQTEDMRKRYQHLFPQGGQSAINSLLG